MRSSTRGFLFLTFSSIVLPSPRPELVSQTHNLTSRIPVYFEPNAGQFDPQVRFLARGAKYQAWIMDREMILVFSCRAPGSADDPLSVRLPSAPTGSPTIESDVVRIKFGLLKPRASKGLDKMESYSNYFLGNDPKKWRSRVPHFMRAQLEEVYPGVDIVFYGKGREIEYDFIVKPGANTDLLSLQFDGSEKPQIDSFGHVSVRTRAGTLTHRAPVVFQDEQIIQASTSLNKDLLKFHLGDYDHSRPVIIDPVLTYSTYFGGSSSDIAFGVAADAAGNAYLVGTSFSSDLLTVAPSQAFGGDADIFITKFAPGGTSLIFSTYLGGAGQETRPDIAIDITGRAYIGGSTTSSNFPIVNGFQTVKGSGGDAFVAVLSAAGNTLDYSSYLGAGSNETAFGVAVGPTGHAYLTGTTSSSTFPQKNAFQPFRTNDSFVARFDPSASGATSLVYSSFLGGTDVDQAQGIAVGSDGSAYVVGRTLSTDFPIVNAFQASNGGDWDVFVTKVAPFGSSIVYSTYLGGSNFEDGFGIAVDSAGVAVLTGSTVSSNFPLQNPIRLTNVDFDAFVSKLSASGTSLIYSTYIGGSETDQGHRVAIQSDGSAYVAGFTQSNNFPAVSGLQPFGGGCCDGFIFKMNPTGSTLLFSSYIGGSDRDVARGVAVDGVGNVYVAGETLSSNLPLANPLQGALNVGFDAFIVKIADAPPDTTPPAITASVSPGANINGWNNSPVNVVWTVVDPQSTITSQTGCGTITLSTETTAAGTTLTSTATSAGGAASQSMTIRIDLTAPIALGSRTPGANANGWNNTNVVVNFTCSDALSGVVAAGSSQTISTEGAGQSRMFVCQDLAGNTATSMVSGINIDKTPLTISGMPSGSSCTLWPPNHKMVRVATVSAADVLSGLVAFSVSGISNEPPNSGETDIVITGTGLQPRSIQLRAERLGNGNGRTYTLTATASDLAGNITSSIATCTVPHDQGH